MCTPGSFYLQITLHMGIVRMVGLHEDGTIKELYYL